MAITITSVTPVTGSTDGGTSVAVVGTNLDTCILVLVDNHAGTIVGTPSPTALTFKTPPGTAGSGKSIRFLDGTTSVTATPTWTYTAPSTPETLVTDLAKKYRVDVYNGSSWTKVRGVRSLQPAINTTTQDDSDFDSIIWASTIKTQLAWSLKLTLKRGKGFTTGNYDPGQEILRAAHDQAGSAGTVQVRWYDRGAGPEAYSGFGSVSWSPKGGDAKALDEVDVTVEGQGARTAITNPVIADPTLT